LLAAHYAPSVGFSQPWNFIVVKDPEIIKRIKELVEVEREKFRNLLPEDRKKVLIK
jgi:cob(II)yrinic acid a,c-diamide reductase (EC 1.16.8.1)